MLVCYCKHETLQSVAEKQSTLSKLHIVCVFFLVFKTVK